jgi:hypothetical protein
LLSEERCVNRFPPPSDEQVTSIWLRMRIVCEIAAVARKGGDVEALGTALEYHKHLTEIYEAMLERQRGATVH